MSKSVKTDNTTPHKAALYDVNVRKTIPFYEQFHAETIDLIRTIKPDVPVWLDTGCGTGFLVEKAAAVFPGTTFLLADPSADMIIQCRKRLERDDFEHIDIRYLGVFDSAHLPLELPRPPQVITAVQTHHYLRPDERFEAVKRCFEILPEGGLFVTFENSKPLTSPGVRYGLERWGAFQMRQGKTETAVLEHRKRFGANYFPLTVAEHLELYKRIGFSTVELFWYSYMQAGFFAIK